GQSITCTGTNLAVGATRTITLNGTVANNATGTLRNQACVETDGDTNPANNCDDADTKVEGGKVKIEKRVSTTAARPGQEVTYTLRVTNTSSVPVTGATAMDDLSDILDDASYNDDVDASTGDVEVDGDELTWSGDLDPGETAIITYSVTVNNRGNHRLANTATVTAPGTNCAEGSNDRQCTSKTNTPVKDKIKDKNTTPGAVRQG
ncbi:DUF11 domain-containing protein, partial [Streptomyces sp. NPDC047023]